MKFISGPKVDQIGLKWDKSGTFSDQISVPKVLESDLKTPGFVPFEANLIDFGAKPSIPAHEGVGEFRYVTCLHCHRLSAMSHFVSNLVRFAAKSIICVFPANVTSRGLVVHGCEIWHPNWVRLARDGTNL